MKHVVSKHFRMSNKQLILTGSKRAPLAWDLPNDSPLLQPNFESILNPLFSLEIALQKNVKVI